MDCNLPGSSVHGILQARILEWVAMPSSRESSWPRDQTLCLLHWQADSEALATYDRKDPDKTGLDKEEKAGEPLLAETPSTEWRGMACRWRETIAMCTENCVYRKPHVQRTACAENRVYRKPHMQRTTCAQNRVCREPRVQKANGCRARGTVPVPPGACRSHVMWHRHISAKNDWQIRQSVDYRPREAQTGKWVKREVIPMAGSCWGVAETNTIL